MSLLLLLLIIIDAYPQVQRFEIGLSAGYTRNSLTTENTNRPLLWSYGLGGFQISTPMQYHLNDWFGLRFDFSYIQKNYGVRSGGPYQGVEYQVKNTYLQAPLMANFSFGGQNLRGFFNFGGYAGYWIDSRINGAVLDFFSPGSGLGENDQISQYGQVINLYKYNERVAFDRRRDRRVELGMLAGVGLGYRLSSHYKVLAEVRYQYSVTDLQKEYMINQVSEYNNTIGIQMGVLYSFGVR